MKELKPLTLRILSHEIKVVFDDPKLWNRDSLGRAHMNAGLIQINKTMTVDAIVSTLLHEIVHIGSDILSIELSEQQIDCAAATIFSALRDNPKLVAMFQESR